MADCWRDQASYAVMAESSKWLEAGEESIVALEKVKDLPGASYELPEAAGQNQKIPRN